MLEAAMIFGDNMVLQRQKNILIWGNGEPGKLVTGKLVGTDTTTAEALIEEDGKWLFTFPPQEAGRNYQLVISDDRDSITFNNISIGEVWLAGGQSNMEYFLNYDADKESVLEGPMNQHIRFFDYPEISYEEQLTEHDYSRFGFWRTCTKEDLPYFSAPGYYFAENLQKTLDIPIGIVGCNWGGTTACSWMDPEYLKDNEGKAWLESYDEAVKDLDVEEHKKAFRANPMNDHSNPLGNEQMGAIMYPGLTREQQLGFLEMMSNGQAKEALVPLIGPFYEKRPGGLYETMLKKVAPYTLRGVIWYQGESDEEKAELYGTVFGKMIECWRDLWKEQLPFLFVQLAPFGEWLAANGSNYPTVRRQQEIVSKTVEKTWMISSSDVGMEWDIHPKHKKPIGNRLALLARGHVYGESLLCDPPEFAKAERVQEGIRLYFKNADGLHLKGDHLNALLITDTEENEILPAGVSIVDDSLLISGEFPEKITLSFAQTSYYEVNLYNKMENPVKPFETTISF